MIVMSTRMIAVTCSAFDVLV